MIGVTLLITTVLMKWIIFPKVNEKIPRGGVFWGWAVGGYEKER